MEKILIVDDDLQILQSMANFLAKKTYRIFTAHNGVEAYVTATVEEPQLLILDLAMPIMDGYAFIKDLNETPLLRNIPILIVTGSARHMKDYFEIIGITHFLTKPFKPQELLDNVNVCLHH